jgi:hypothetical protein
VSEKAPASAEPGPGDTAGSNVIDGSHPGRRDDDDALPQESPGGFDQRAPNAARIYDWLIGGKDHYAADRAAGRRLAAAIPGIRQAAADNRAFLARVTRYLAAVNGRSVQIPVPWAIRPASQGSPAPPMTDPAFMTPMAAGASRGVVSRGAIAIVVGKTGPRKKPSRTSAAVVAHLRQQQHPADPRAHTDEHERGVGQQDRRPDRFSFPKLSVIGPSHHSPHSDDRRPNGPATSAN